MYPSDYYPSVCMTTATAALSMRQGVDCSRWGRYLAVRRPIDEARTWCSRRLAAGGVKKGGRSGARGQWGKGVKQRDACKEGLTRDDGRGREGLSHASWRRQSTHPENGGAADVGLASQLSKMHIKPVNRRDVSRNIVITHGEVC